MNKTYYAFTKPSNKEGYVLVDGEVVSEFTIPMERATIAVEYDGETFRYGVSICSHNDNFCRKEGRRIARDRMRFGFGAVHKSAFTKLKFMANPDVPDQDKALAFLRTVVESVEKRLEKYKRKIRNFSDEEKELRNNI